MENGFQQAGTPSLPVRRAVIDVGTNSVKLLVADVSSNGIHPIAEDSRQTRLGSGFYQTHLLQPEPIQKTAEAVAYFAKQARLLEASSVRVIGTSAARDALNANELIEAIRQHSGLTLEVVSGEQEADWAFRGVCTDHRLAGQPLLILDVGGGSTEFIVGDRSVQMFRNSFRLGTVRLFESMTLADPPGVSDLAACVGGTREFLRKNVAPTLAPALAQCGSAPQLVGTGGTTTILARMENAMEDFDRDRIEATRISLDRLREWGAKLWQMKFSERQTIPGLPPKRADVILTGVAIYQAIMEEFGFSDLRTSTRGLRYSALL